MTTNPDKLLFALINFVNDNSAPYREKKAAIRAKMDEDDETKMAVEEFLSWFEGDTL